MPPKPLTLIVATTPIPRTAPENATTTSTSSSGIRLGIGLNGTLPWPRIKTDMSFFARVTSRAPKPGATNAIIMGRKTYDSVPAHLRPLGKRISTVITRDSGGEVRRRVLEELEAKRRREEEQAATKGGPGAGNGLQGGEPAGGGPKTDAIVCSGLEEAIERLGERDAEGILGGMWVIGGAEIYAAALRLRVPGEKVRIVMTNVERRDGAVFECDTFFPIDEELLSEKGWRRVSDEDVSGWVGETVTSEWKEEGEVRVQMVGYERVD